MRVLITFHHGLGDAVQLGVVLRHLRKAHPEWTLDVAALRGKHSALRGLGHHVHVIEDEKPLQIGYDRVYSLAWPEPEYAYGDCPSTKAEKCLREVFGVQPELDLCGYSIGVGDEAMSAAFAYFDSIGAGRGAGGKYDVVLLHYQGNTSTERKNLPHDIAARCCERIRAAGCVPVILDWDRRSPLPDGKQVFCPDTGNDLWKGYGTGDAERIAALIRQARLFVGIDSGPAKVAGAVSGTPAIAVWTGHHPVHYHGLGGHVTHLIPFEAKNLIRGGFAERDAGEAFFQSHYVRQVYGGVGAGLLADVLCEMIDHHLQPGGRAPVPDRIDKFYVGIPTLCRYDLLQETIASIFNGTAVPERIYVIDNGGKWGGHPDSRVQVVRPVRNLGVAASWNLLRRLTRPAPLVISNDDLRVGRNTLERVVQMRRPFVAATRDSAFSLFLMREEVWQSVGEFDEAFWPAYHEDNDMHQRMRLNGYDVDAPLGSDPVMHHVSSTIRSNPPELAGFEAHWEAGRRHYIRKWGGPPGEEKVTTTLDTAPAPNLDEMYRLACSRPSDVNEHCQTLRELAEGLSHITELGTCEGNSTVALLHAKPATLVCYPRPFAFSTSGQPSWFRSLVASTRAETTLRFVNVDPRHAEIESTDLLFIDTLGTYERVQAELAAHGRKARRYIVLHDTTIYGQIGEDGGRGIWQAVEEFLTSNVTEWSLDRRLHHNNGLAVLCRRRLPSR